MIKQQNEAEKADVPCARDYSRPLPDVTRDVHETFAAREASDPAYREALWEEELEEMLQSIDDYYATNDPLMTGAGVGDDEPCCLRALSTRCHRKSGTLTTRATTAGSIRNCGPSSTA